MLVNKRGQILNISKEFCGGLQTIEWLPFVGMGVRCVNCDPMIRVPRRLNFQTIGGSHFVGTAFLFKKNLTI